MILAIDMKSRQTIASFYIQQNDAYRYLKTTQLTGYVTVGDSTDYRSNQFCSRVSDTGFYTCSKPLQGRYLAYFIEQSVPNLDLVVL